MQPSAQRLVAVLAVVVLVLVTVSISHASEDLYSGRAMGASVRGVEATPVNSFVDTGELPAPGGELQVSEAALQVCLFVLRSRNLHSATQSEVQRARSWSSQSDVVVFDALPMKVTASQVVASAIASCEDLTGSSTISDLTFGGQPVEVTGEPNQVVTLPGMATLIINEHVVDERERSITVNALHIMLEAGADVIVSAARAGLACPVAVDAVSWQEVKSLYR